MAFKIWIGTKWIGSLYFCFFLADFLLSNLHYLRHNVQSDLPRYYMSGGDVEYYLWDATWYMRVALLLLLSIILGWKGYKATTKEIACSTIYMVIAFKDCYDYFTNHNQGTTLIDYTILFVSLTLVHIYFSWKKNPKFYEWQ
jgi:hypothetical protein